MRALFLSLLATAALAACGASDTGDTAEDAAAFIRLPAPGASMTAAYLSVSRDSDDRLVAAEIDGVERVELHTNNEVDGVMQMRRVEGFEVTAGEPLVLAPRGNHLMLFGVAEDFAEGEMRTVTLTFESGAVETLQLPVKRNAMGAAHSGH